MVESSSSESSSESDSSNSSDSDSSNSDQGTRDRTEEKYDGSADYIIVEANLNKREESIAIRQQRLALKAFEKQNEKRKFNMNKSEDFLNYHTPGDIYLISYNALNESTIANRSFRLSIKNSTILQPP